MSSTTSSIALVGGSSEASPVKNTSKRPKCDLIIYSPIVPYIFIIPLQLYFFSEFSFFDDLIMQFGIVPSFLESLYLISTLDSCSWAILLCFSLGINLCAYRKYVTNSNSLFKMLLPSYDHHVFLNVIRHEASINANDWNLHCI